MLVDGEVQALSPADGTVLTSLPVSDDVQVGPAGPVTLVRVDGRLHALDGTTGATLWDVPALGLPTPPPAAKDDRTVAALLVPEDGAFVQRDPSTGAELGRFAAVDLPAGGTATQVGPVVVLRLPERVLGYR